MAGNGKAALSRKAPRQLAASRAASEPTKEVNLGDLPDQLGFLVRRVQLWVFREFTRKLAQLDVTLAQYSVLTVVDANPGINQLAIASALDIERAGLGRLIERLEARNVLKRLPSTIDRRSYVLHLTSEGRKALARMRAIVHESETRLAERFKPGDAEDLKQILSAFRDD
ncbi:MAG TPA: MarR family transcriptional regulator [Hyphomicrobiaceae bacterium]|nr:MarR family transcriptional regulator [Hyphomicrobiaceae bacterium]